MSFFSWLGIGKERAAPEGAAEGPPPAIYCDEASKNALASFKLGGFFQIADHPRSADLIWMRKGSNYRPLMRELRPFQPLNHLPNERAVSDKGYLAEHLKEYDAVRKTHEFGMKDIAQETYCLEFPDERERFFNQLPEIESKEHLWILKPCDSSKGKGIKILWQFDELRESFSGNQKTDDEGRAQRYVIQRYIKNPLLLMGRKSEIRIYWLVASLDPLLVLMWREGTVRLNTLPFTLDDFDNTLIHVTNAFQQKSHPEHDPSAVLKWSFADWEKYLIEDLKIAPQNYLEGHLKPHLKRMLSFVIHAAAPTLAADHPKKGLCFGFYGADIIFDDNLHPWLTEVQEGPGLSLDDPIKQRVIPAMLNEAAAIMLEVARRKREHLSLKEIDAVQGFEWVANEA